MRVDRRTWVPLVGLIFLSGCGEGTPEAGDGETAIGLGGPMRVYFDEPTDGAEVGPDVRVVLGTENLEVVEAGVFEPGTGHHHIFVDVDATPAGEVIPAGIPEVIHKGDGTGEHLIEGLSPGQHRLIAVVGDGAHVPIEPPVTDTIFITVVGGAP